MKKVSVIFLIVIFNVLLIRDVYPGGLEIKCGINLNQTKPLYYFSGGEFSYENKRAQNSLSLTVNAATLNLSVDYNELSGKMNWLSHANRQDRMRSEVKPDISGSKVLAEITCGIVGNVAFALAGFAVGEEMSSYNDWFSTSSIVGMYAGSAIGSALGVYLVGSSGNVKGSFGKALLGSTIGSVLSFGSLFVLSYFGFLFLTPVLPPLFATLMFNNSLRYKTPPTDGTALLNLRDGKLRLGVPLVNVQPLFDAGKTGKKSFRVDVNLLSIKL